jgi:DNA gyrase subunit A
VQAEQLIPDGDVILTLSDKGEVQRIMNLAGKPRSGRDYTHILTVNNRNDLLLISKEGRVWRHPVHQLPEKTGQSRGARLADVLSGWSRSNEVAAAIDVPSDVETLEGHFLLAVTRNGRLVRVSAPEVKNLHSGTSLVNVEEGDEVLWAGLSNGSNHIVLVSAQGQAIQFAEADVRPTGLGVQGVWGMKLEAKNDAVVGAGLATQGSNVVVVSKNGFYKRTPLSEYPTQGRYGKGVRAMNLDKNTGPLVAATVADLSDRLTFHTSKGKSFNTHVRHVPGRDRYHQGEPLAELPGKQHVSALVKWGTESAWSNGGSGSGGSGNGGSGTDSASRA